MNDQEFLNRTHESVTVDISPSQTVCQAITAEMKRKFGEDGYYDPMMKAIRGAGTSVTLKNTTMLEALKFAEGLRISHPHQNVNVSVDKEGGDFICHVTWNDQVRYYPEYDIYTKEGKAKAGHREVA